VLSYLSKKWGTTLYSASKQIIFEGDSLTQGVHGEASPYPHNLITHDYSAINLHAANLGRAGNYVTIISSEAPNRIDPLYDSSFSKNIVVVWGGTNDLACAPYTAANTYNLLKSFCTNRKAAGFNVVFMTCLPRQDAAVTQGDFETKRQAYNALLRADFNTAVSGYVYSGAAWADYMVDVESNTNLQDPNNLTYFSSDKCHLTVTGYAQVSAAVKVALDLLL
jgi:lysophospholipase L1-like esterase